MVPFCPLHVLSYYSALEGVDSPAALLRRAAQAGYDTLALTDINSLAGAVEFVRTAGQTGIRPLVGARLRHQSRRATALIAEPSGWKSLSRIITRLYQGTAPLDKLLLESSQGLQLLTDDPQLLRAAIADAYRGRLWVELIRPGKTAAQEQELLAAAAVLGVRPVASTAVHFAWPAGHEAYRLLWAIRNNKTLDQLPERLPVQPAHHLTEPAGALSRFRDISEAAANTVRVAAACRSDVLPRDLVPPPAQVPPGQDPLEYLALECRRALPSRASAYEASARARLDEELALIAQHGLASYFLLVRELTAEAARRDWPVVLRGSAGAALVCYLLGIGSINPLQYALKLERFLHPGRPDPPDIDLDFAAECRPAALHWLTEHVGRTRLAQVGCWHHFAGRSALRFAAAAHGVPAGQISPLLEGLPGVDQLGTAAEPEELTTPPAAFPLNPGRWAAVLDSARLLLGKPHRLERHPCGLVLATGPIEDHVPLQKSGLAPCLTQLDGSTIEQIGLVKLDLLSSHSLSALAEGRIRQQALAPAPPPADDSDLAVIELLGRGETVGVSQVETPALRAFLRRCRPRSLEELTQALAATRPTAGGGVRDSFLRRRHGLEPVAYAHPDLEAVLAGSLGLLLFDDDGIETVAALTGLSAPEADQLRRQLQSEGKVGETAFLQLCADNGIPAAAAAQALAQLQHYQEGEYGFCRAHALAYAWLAWQECHLKAHCPVAFWCGALNHVQGSYPRRVHVEAARRSGVAIHPPCVNRSLREWSVEVSGVRVGLGEIRSADGATLSAIVAERLRGGPFASLSEFTNRVQCGDHQLGLLIRCGCFDFLGRGRELLLREAKLAQAGRLSQQWADRTGAEDWPFDGLLLPGLPATDWRAEWELLGFLPSVPLMSLVRLCAPPGLTDSRLLGELVGEEVRLAGLVASCKNDPHGRNLRYLLLEDEFGFIEVQAEGTGEDTVAGPVVLVEGRVADRQGVPQVTGATVSRLRPSQASARPGAPRLRVVS